MIGGAVEDVVVEVSLGGSVAATAEDVEHDGTEADHEDHGREDAKGPPAGGLPLTIGGGCHRKRLLAQPGAALLAMPVGFRILGATRGAIRPCGRRGEWGRYRPPIHGAAGWPVGAATTRREVVSRPARRLEEHVELVLRVVLIVLIVGLHADAFVVPARPPTVTRPQDCARSEVLCHGCRISPRFRVAEGWSAGNFVGVALLVVLAVLVAWSNRSFLQVEPPIERNPPQILSQSARTVGL